MSEKYYGILQTNDWIHIRGGQLFETRSQADHYKEYLSNLEPGTQLMIAVVTPLMTAKVLPLDEQS